MATFTIEIREFPKNAFDHGHQERAAVNGALQQAAQAIGRGTDVEGPLTYDNQVVGAWSFGEGSHAHREHTRRDGPGTFAALTPEEREARGYRADHGVRKVEDAHAAQVDEAKRTTRAALKSVSEEA
jgi:hypothetical protein